MLSAIRSTGELKAWQTNFSTRARIGRGKAFTTLDSAFNRRVDALQLSPFSAIIFAPAILKQIARSENTTVVVSAATSPASTPAIAGKSIAVLPFENFSDDKENAFFTDGVQDRDPDRPGEGGRSESNQPHECDAGTRAGSRGICARSLSNSGSLMCSKAASSGLGTKCA